MSNNKFGFKDGDLEIITQTLAKVPGINKAVIFGSRAKGNYQAGSDTDIAVWTMNDSAVSQLSGILNDQTLLPYKFDILNYGTIDNPGLKEQINRTGVEIYHNPV
ncbi:MAG: nucleotidyltransferase family protein [Sphingobacteriales bacterium]